MIVSILGMCHCQRQKDVLIRKILERFSAHTLHDLREQEVSGVAVLPIAARGEIQRLLPHNDSERIVVGRHTVRIHTRKEKQPVVPHTGRVIQKLKNGYLLTTLCEIVWQLWNVFADVIIQAQLASFFQ